VSHTRSGHAQHRWPACRLLRRVGSWLTTLLLLLTITGTGLAGWAVHSGAWQGHPVLSGSMEPVLPTGSVAVMRQVPTSELRVGDVVTFRAPSNPQRLVTHRITSITTEDGQRLYETKGDANRANDPWKVTLRGDVSYRLHGDIPYVGYAAVWLRQPQMRTGLLGAGALLGLWAVLQLFLPAGRRNTAQPTPPAHHRQDMSPRQR
jgi:signal peptidase I